MQYQPIIAQIVSSLRKCSNLTCGVDISDGKLHLSAMFTSMKFV